MSSPGARLGSPRLSLRPAAGAGEAGGHGAAFVARPSWPMLTFVSHGTIVGVCSDDPDALAELGRQLPVGARVAARASADTVYTWTTGGPGRGACDHAVVAHCRRHAHPRQVARGVSLADAVRLLVHDAEFRIAMYAPDHVFVHAAVVEWGGRAVVVPGASFAGKSTLAAELVRRGARYFSDEYAVFDRAGLVHPFARRLSLRDAAGRSAARVAAEELGGRVGVLPVPLGAVVDTRYVAGAEWTPVAASRGATLLALLANTIDVRARPEQSLAQLGAAVGPATRGLTGVRGDAATMAERLLAVLDER